MSNDIYKEESFYVDPYTIAKDNVKIEVMVSGVAEVCYSCSDFGTHKSVGKVIEIYACEGCIEEDIDKEKLAEYLDKHKEEVF